MLIANCIRVRVAHDETPRVGKKIYTLSYLPPTGLARPLSAVGRCIFPSSVGSKFPRQHDVPLGSPTGIYRP